MSAEAKTKGEKLLDVGMGWLVRYEHSDSWIDFKAYEVTCTDTDGTNPQYRRKGARSGMDTTENPDEADCLDGYVKWDGCMEVHLKQSHFCGARDVGDYCSLLTQLHALCLLLPSVDRACADYPEVPVEPKSGYVGLCDCAGPWGYGERCISCGAPR